MKGKKNSDVTFVCVRRTEARAQRSFFVYTFSRLDLSFICEEYLQPLQANKILNDSLLQDIFRNVESLRSFHSVLLGTIEDKIGTEFDVKSKGKK